MSLNDVEHFHGHRELATSRNEAAAPLQGVTCVIARPRFPVQHHCEAFLRSCRKEWCSVVFLSLVVRILAFQSSTITAERHREQRLLFDVVRFR